MKIELFLDGHRIEIDKDIDFVLNKQFTELTDLTSIIVDYSKTIKVPMTPHNNELFNYVYRLDRQVLSDSLISINYDPTQKINMYMTFNGSKVMDGYALLNSVNLKDKTYEINIYGQLGKIFSDLKDKKLVNWHNPHNGWSKRIKMNTSAIKKSFDNSNHSLDWTSTDWTDFFGFAPQMIGKTDILKTDCYEEYNTGNIVKFVDYINNARSIDYAEYYVKDGFDIYQYNEMRSYTGRPYVYVDKLIQMVQAEINQGDYDDYTMILDADWFNSDNPYYANLCYFPATETPVDSGESNTGVVAWNNTERTLTFPTSYLPTVTTSSLDGYTYSTSGNVITVSPSGGGDFTDTLTLNCDGILVRERVDNVYSFGYPEQCIWTYYNLNNIVQIPVRYIGIYDGSDNLIYKLYICDDYVISVDFQGPENEDKTYYRRSGIWNMLKRIDHKYLVPNTMAKECNGVSRDYIQLIQQFNFGDIVLNTNSFQFKTGCDILDMSTGTIVQENISMSSYSPLKPYTLDFEYPIWKNDSTYTHTYAPIPSMTVSSNNFRSGSYWTINDILGEFNPFTWLIDYVKMFRLFFDIDYTTKTITLKKGYFNNVTYKKVTVDYDKGMTVEPVIDKYNSVEFGYKKNECKKGPQYYKKYGVEYGDISVDTRMTINNDTLTLTPNKDLGVFIPVTLKGLYWNNLKTTDPILVGNELGTNKVITTLDKDDKIKYFPFYAFRYGNKTSSLYITDDSPNQRNTGEYCYLDQGTGWQNMVEDTETTGHCQDCGYEGEMIGGVCPNCGSTNVTTVSTDVYYAKLVTSFPQFENYYFTIQIWGSPIPIPHIVRHWNTFNTPSEVYDGTISQSTSYDFSIYSQRWQNYLNEIFNVHNNKVTCYVRLSYPEFINFKFNQLFVIDNVTFLVNKIIDFNPNSQGPTKVELIEVSDPNNLQ